MALNWTRLALAIVGMFVAYTVVYLGGMAGLGLSDVMAAYGRADSDPLAIYAVIGHLIETTVIAAIYFAWVRSNDLRVGALYGLLFGLYYAATQLSTMGGFGGLPADVVMPFLPLHIVAGVVAGGLVPALVYCGPKLTTLPAE